MSDFSKVFRSFRKAAEKKEPTSALLAQIHQGALEKARSVWLSDFRNTFYTFFLDHLKACFGLPPLADVTDFQLAFPFDSSTAKISPAVPSKNKCSTSASTAFKEVAQSKHLQHLREQPLKVMETV
jgi:hypothetical protein